MPRDPENDIRLAKLAEENEAKMTAMHPDDFIDGLKELGL